MRKSAFVCEACAYLCQDYLHNKLKQPTHVFSPPASRKVLLCAQLTEYRLQNITFAKR